MGPRAEPWGQSSAPEPAVLSERGFPEPQAAVLALVGSTGAGTAVGHALAMSGQVFAFYSPCFFIVWPVLVLVFFLPKIAHKPPI